MYETYKILGKYYRINEAGTLALREQNPGVFSGYTEALKNRFNVSVRFTWQLWPYFRARIGRLLDWNNISNLLAGLDYPLHCTVLEGLFTGDSVQERDKLFKRVSRDPELVKIVEYLAEQFSIPFRYILVGGGGSNLMLASDVLKLLPQLREDLGKIYVSHGLKVLDLDIVHATIVRITEFSDTWDWVEHYEGLLGELRGELLEKPAVLTPQRHGVHSGSAYNLIQKS